MNLKFQELQVDPDKPFEKDLLNRKMEVENLTSLVSNVNTPAVLAINSSWGTGKTTFIKMWEGFLKQNDFDSLYFNAWTTDFSDDPLVAFLGEMNSGLEDLIGGSKESKKAWRTTKKIGANLVRRGIPALIRMGTAGVIDVSDVAKEELSRFIDGMTENALENYFKQKDIVSQFRNSLSQFIKVSDSKKPVVFFIDELDRCRPTYAISLLERIKHLFNIEGLVFVLSLDKTQLGHSLGAVYGGGIDSVSYLRRFIDFEYRLRQPEIKDYIKSLFGALALDEFFKAREIYPDFRGDKEMLEKVFLMLAKAHQLSLREIEQLIASINLALRTAKEKEFIHPELLTFLVLIKNMNLEMYKRYISPTNSGKELTDYLREILQEPIRNGDRYCSVLEASIIIAKMDRGENLNEIVAHHKSILADGNVDSEIKKHSEYIMHYIDKSMQGYRGIDLAQLAERVDMLSQFQFK